MKNEIWLPVVGYEGIYEISNIGRLKSLSRICNTAMIGQYMRAERILKPFSSRGYFYVKLTKDGKETSLLLHRLVAISFIPNPLKCSSVNHLNGEKVDCNVENLEWCTPLQNTQHAIITGLRTSKRVINSINGCIYKDVKEAAASLSMNYKTLYCRLTGSMKNNTGLKYL